MPLEGIRAWIGEVERKLGMRTRVFLVLTAIAIGGSGAAIYLALDTRDDAVSESDVRELQGRLEERIATGQATAPEQSFPESGVPAPEPSEPAPAPNNSGGTGTGSDSGETDSGSAGIDTKAEAEAKLKELAEQAKERSEAEAEQGAGIAP